MDNTEIDQYRNELLAQYPGCRIKIAPDRQEIVAEISDLLAVAIIQRSQAHFHRKTTEIYRVLRGTLLVARGGQGFVLREGETITIEPGQIHYAKAAAEPVWIEVFCEPAWSTDDHFVLEDH